MKARISAGLVAGLCVAGLALPSAASAAWTIGSNLVSPPESSSCGAATFTNTKLASGLQAPFTGAIVRWRMDLLQPGGNFEYRLRVLRPVGGGQYLFVESGPPQKAPSAGINVLTLPQPLPVEAGDIIAYFCPQGAPSPGTIHGLSTTTRAYFAPSPADGATLGPTNQLAGQEELINADLVGVPSILAVLPPAGSSNGGTEVTIIGNQLTEVTAVTFGGVPATAVTPVSETQIRATTPPHAAGSVDVQVTNPAGTTALVPKDQFKFLQAPSPPVTKTTAPPAPIVTAFAETNRTWRLTAKHAAKAKGKLPPVGTSFSFTLNEPASVSLSFAKTSPGRKAKGKCVAPSAANRSKPACKRSIPSGVLPLSGSAGSNSVPFHGRLSSGKSLKPGSYAVTIVATGAAGKPSQPQTLRFRIAG